MLWVSFLTVQLVTADRRSEYYLISVHASRGIAVPGQKVRGVGFGTRRWPKPWAGTQRN